MGTNIFLDYSAQGIPMGSVMWGRQVFKNVLIRAREPKARVGRRLWGSGEDPAHGKGPKILVPAWWPRGSTHAPTAFRLSGAC